MFKLEKSVFLNKRILQNKLFYTFTSQEIDFIKHGIPDFVKLGSDLTLLYNKIYYIKNQNNRYSDLLQNKKIKSFLKTKVHKQAVDGKSEKSSCFYLSKSSLKLKNLKRKGSISILPGTSFAFQNCQPIHSGNSALSSTLGRLDTNFFTPNFCILIRKVKQYSIFKPQNYKNTLSQNNQRTAVSNSLNSRRLLTNLTWFNKQAQTRLFSDFPSADLQINCSSRFKNSKKIFITKKLNIFEFFILLNIPKIFPFKAAKIGFNSKQTFLSINSAKEGSLIQPLSPWSESPSNQQQINFKTQSLQIQELGNLIRCQSSSFPKQPNVQSSFQNLLCNDKFNKKYKNIIRRHLGIFYKTNRLEFILFRQIDNSSFMVPALKTKTTQFTNTKVVLHPQNYIFANNPLSLTDFFSPYQGEITDLKSDSLGKQSCFFLTEKDQLSFNTNNNMPFTFVGKLIRYGEQLAENISIPNSGQIIQVEKSKVILRKAHPILFSAKGVFYVHHGDFVEKNSPLLTLFYQRLKTGDIVQGIPKIEQLFEARQTKEGEILPENLHDKLHDFFEKYKQKYSPQDAARKSLEKTQQLLVDGVQRVYQSQGVTIADKHLEVIVRQMTSKVKIIEGGQSGLLRGELINLDWIEIVNKGINSQKAEYEPVILGITKAALETESFISAASFQETTRILARAAIERKTDFLRGLKENVILGHLIPAGTGFSLSFNPQSSDYSTKAENVKFFKNLCLGLKRNDT